MPKMKLKTHSGTSKRFRRTGTGKLVRHKAGRRHLLTGKSRSRKRRLTGTAVVDQATRLNVSRLMPYS